MQKMLQIIVYLRAHYARCVNLYPKQKVVPFLEPSLRIMLAHTFYTNLQCHLNRGFKI